MNNKKISQNLYTYFEQAGRVQHYNKGEQIYFQGDPSKQFFIIKEGRVCAYFISEAGSKMTLEIIEKGRIFGESSFLSQSSHIYNVEAVNNVELISCSLDALLPYINQSQELTIILFQLLSQTIEHLSNQVHHTHFLDRYSKVASFLVEQTSNPNSDKNITSNCLPYSHEEIALCIGLSRGTVTRALNIFKEKDFVILKYKRVIIKDKEGLQSIIKER